MQPIWGIDLGGTKIEGVILESRDNIKVLERLRVPTESTLGYAHVLDQIQTCISLLQDRSGLLPDKIGIGTPGVLDPILQTMKNCNSVVLNGQPLKEDLENLLQIPVTMANDANCFAIAEAQLGIVRDHFKNPEVVFGVILGTGVGGGVVVNGRVVTGRQGIGGEWGHNFLDASGGPCYCGKIGCVETVIAGPSLEKFYMGQGGTSKKLPEIMANYHAGNDPIATATVNRLIQFFGKGISTVINILDPDAIVLGGGVGNIDLLYSQGVEEVKKHVFNNRLDTLFLKPKLGDSAGVFGAALLE